MLIVDTGVVRVERQLRAGKPTCPSCGAMLAPWGHGRPREVRGDLGSRLSVRPRRSRCTGYQVTHVLLPEMLWPRRMDEADGPSGLDDQATARVLLALDTSAGEIGSQEVIAARLGVSGETLRLAAKRFTETGGDVHATIARKKRDLPPVPSPVTGEAEARLIAMACSQPPRAMPGGRCGCWRSTSRWPRTSPIWTTPPSGGS
ncbi:hypothetical protein ABT187_47645 [Streptomyces sp. NPDC001817]|uniref:hypothetical protein n=1 Tax=Streptomyces sp. NPDC001817 TaxID=3154398 RepID=UPI003325F38F